jgi:hypothetical protein
MRSITKTMLRTCAGLAAAAALVVGGAGVASAATTSPATHSSNSWYGYGCNPWAREHWNLNGTNSVENNQFSPPYTYSITFHQYGSCLGGTMTDSYYPTTGPIHGTVNGNRVTFSFTYPSGSIQGTRTFYGYINRWGYVSGYWNETGSEGASSSWYLANHVHRACPWWYWQGANCYVW